MSYGRYESPQFGVAIWYNDVEYSSEYPRKILPILEEHGFFPPKSMDAGKNIFTKNSIKDKTIYPATKDMKAQEARDFFIKCYAEEDIMGLYLMNHGKRERRNGDFWAINWNFTCYKSPKLLEPKPIFMPSNIFSIDSTYDRFAEEENLTNFFTATKRIIEVLNPYYANIEDTSTAVSVMDRTKERFFEPNYLQSIYWGNYFGEKLCKDLGMDKLNKLPVKNKETLGNGFFFTLTDDILDSRDNPDFRLRKKIYKFLNPSVDNHMAF